MTAEQPVVLRGWRCPHTKLCRVPLQAHVTNLSNHTLVIDCSTGTESLNSLYSLPSTAKILNHIKASTQDLMPSPLEATNNVYELPSIESAICYLYGTADFPTKANWVKGRGDSERTHVDPTSGSTLHKEEGRNLTDN